MNHLEIEYKTLLTKDEYNRLAMLFSHVTPVTQTNYYIDTPQSDMRSKKLSLRIRTLPTHGVLLGHGTYVHFQPDTLYLT